MAHIFIDEKGPQESFQISDPFNWKEKIKYGADTMHGYVADVWYISDENLLNFERDLLKLESDYMESRQSSVNELKGSILLGRRFNKFGIASMNNREVDFYQNLIKLCHEYNSENMLLSVNKMSVIVNARLLDWIYTIDEKRLIDNPYLFMYTIIKYFDVEASQLAIETLLDKDKTVNELLTVIQNEMNLIISRQSKNKRMAPQVNEYRLIVKVIRNSKHYAKESSDEPHFDWNKVIFDMDLWLSEKNLVQNEYSESIICHLDSGIPDQYFTKFNFKEVRKDCNSKEVAGVRVADYFVGIAGGYIKNLRRDNLYNPDSPEEPKRLPKEWFDFNENQFSLVKNLANFFFDGSQYSFVVDTYFDNEEFFHAFLTYVSTYKNFQDFSRIGGEVHTEKVFAQYYQFSLDRWQLAIPTASAVRKLYGSYRIGVNKGYVRPL
ncbi:MULTISPECIES: hypothetical protein [Enterococcus]|uniref:hypothetical protein n=1 Tax=Enterococcus TaxID=1350 RepID=UPI00372CF89C